MWFETRQRIIAILKTLGSEPVPDTLCIVAESIPPSRSDHHGYLILVKPNRDTVQAITAPESRTHLLNFAIECYSPQVLTGQAIVNEYRIEAYADVITARLEQYPQLGDPTTKKGLTGVQSVFVAGSIFQTPRPYTDQQHYSVTVNLQVTFRRATGC